MAAVKFSRRANRGRQQRFEATFTPGQANLKRSPTHTSAEMLSPRPGPAAFFPQGTDTRTPGFPRERKRTSTRGYTQR